MYHPRAKRVQPRPSFENAAPPRTGLRADGRTRALKTEHRPICDGPAVTSECRRITEPPRAVGRAAARTAEGSTGRTRGRELEQKSGTRTLRGDQGAEQPNRPGLNRTLKRASTGAVYPRGRRPQDPSRRSSACDAPGAVRSRRPKRHRPSGRPRRRFANLPAMPHDLRFGLLHALDILHLRPDSRRQFS